MVITRGGGVKGGGGGRGRGGGWLVKIGVVYVIIIGMAPCRRRRNIKHGAHGSHVNNTLVVL